MTFQPCLHIKLGRLMTMNDWNACSIHLGVHQCSQIDCNTKFIELRGPDLRHGLYFPCGPFFSISMNSPEVKNISKFFSTFFLKSDLNSLSGPIKKKLKNQKKIFPRGLTLSVDILPRKWSKMRYLIFFNLVENGFILVT